MKGYYYSSGDTRNGPISKEDLVEMIKTSKLTGNSLIWSINYDDWTQIKDSEEFSIFLLPPNLPKETPPPLPSKETNVDFTNLFEKTQAFFIANKNYTFLSVAIFSLVGLFILFRTFSARTEPQLEVVNSEIGTIISEQEITDLDKEGRSRLILDNLDFNILTQPTNGQATVELVNKSSLYSFDFDRVFIQLEERKYRFYQLKPTKNISISKTKIEGGGKIRFTLPVADEYSITGWSILYGKNNTTIYLISN